MRTTPRCVDWLVDWLVHEELIMLAGPSGPCASSQSPHTVHAHIGMRRPPEQGVGAAGRRRRRPLRTRLVRLWPIICLYTRRGLIPSPRHHHIHHRPVCLADLDKPHGGTDDDTNNQNARRAKAAGRNQRYRLARHSMKGLVSSEVFVRPSWGQQAGGQAGAGAGGSAAALPFEPCEEDYATAYLNRAVRLRFRVSLRVVL